MATKGKFDLKGLNEYLERIAEAGLNVDAAVKKALEAGGRAALEGMLMRVPIDTHNLQEHLTVDPVKREGNYSFIRVGIPHNIQQTDAETARYANAQEYGTSSMAATPYIRPTIEEDGALIKRVMKDVLKEEGVVG
jgi:HK97 gp10 family phage protein